MKKVYIAKFIFFLTLCLSAQKKKSEVPFKVYGIDSTKFSTLDKTIKTLYDVISAEKKVERNWGEFKALFKPDAKLIPTKNDNKGVCQVSYMSPNDYIQKAEKWLLKNGYIEKEIHRTVNSFNNIIHIFSTFESYYSKSDKHPFMRGIKSIQLLNDGKRWWIINLYWTQEGFENPIPKSYLPK